MSERTHVASFLATLNEHPKKLSPYWKGFPRLAGGEPAVDQYQQQVTVRFFKKPNGSLISNRKTVPYNLDGIPSRSRIIFIYSISENKEKDVSTSYKFGGETHTFNHVPTLNQPINVHYNQIGSYEKNITPKLQEIIARIAPSNLPKLLSQSRVSGNALTPIQLLKENYRASFEEAVEDTTFLNRFQILLDLEVARRLHPKDQYHGLPIGESCARAFILAKKEKYHLFDMFRLFQGQVEERQAEVLRINSLFYEEKSELRRALNISDYHQVNKWQETHPHGVIVARPEEMHQELLEEYGGGYESDGEDYNTKIPE